MQEELITDAAMQYHTINEYINYWARVSKRVFKTYFEMRNPGGDCGLEAKLFEVAK